MKNNNWIWWTIGVIVVLGILLYLPRAGKKQVATDVPCLAPNIPLTQHIHPIIKIMVDGAVETIPANIGLGACERALHTHDTTGTLHVEAQDPREYTLKDFFDVWGKTIERKEYTITIFVDGAPFTAPVDKLLLRDKQEIVIEYNKK